MLEVGVWGTVLYCTLLNRARKKGSRNVTDRKQADGPRIGWIMPERADRTMTTHCDLGQCESDFVSWYHLLKLCPAQSQQFLLLFIRPARTPTCFLSSARASNTLERLRLILFTSTPSSHSILNLDTPLWICLCVWNAYPNTFLQVMSLKAELETWAAALKAYDEQDFENSLELFSVCSIFHSDRLLPVSIFVYNPSHTCRFRTAHRRFFKNPHKYGSHPCYTGRAWTGCWAIYRGDQFGSIFGCRVSNTSI